MATNKNMNVHEALEYLEDLEVSTEEESDGKEFSPRGNFFISPPLNVNGKDTDEDSGD